MPSYPEVGCDADPDCGNRVCPRFAIPPTDVPRELHDLANDPQEQNNLAAEMAEQLRMIREEGEPWMDEMALSEPGGPFSHSYFELLGFPRRSSGTTQTFFVFRELGKLI